MYEVFKERVPDGGAEYSLGNILDDNERSSGRTSAGGSFPGPIPGGGSRRGEIARDPMLCNCDLCDERIPLVEPMLSVGFNTRIPLETLSPMTSCETE